MPQLHLYLPRALAEEVRRRADRKGVSVSRFLADLVRAQVADDWPEDFFSEVVGGWHGAPLQRPSQPPLERREPFDAGRGRGKQEAPEHEDSAGEGGPVTPGDRPAP